MATVFYREERDSWEVRWREPEVVYHDGVPFKKWMSKRRIAPTKADAERLRREIEQCISLGQTWVDKRLVPLTPMKEVVISFIQSSARSGLAEATVRHRAALLGAWVDWFGEDRPIAELSLSILDNYSAHLPSDGRAASTRHRKVLVVEQLWRWAWERRDAIQGVPEPRRLTGIDLRAPAPVIAMAAPTWLQVDAMIRQLQIPWHRTAALMQRYTGMRVSQVCGFQWKDVQPERGLLVVPMHLRGSKGGRTRVLPLHPALAEVLAEWKNVCRDPEILFPRRYLGANGQRLEGPFRGDALVDPYRRAWQLAKVPPEVWDVTDEERGHGSPSHAIRRCVRTELIRLGVQESVVLHLIGHAAGHTAAAYVPVSSPEQSPWWPLLVAAMRKIPPHS